MIRGTGLSFSYAGGAQIVDNLDIDVGQGEIVVLLGASGCGKSTLLRLLAGLLPPDNGQVKLEAASKVGFVFQDAALMPWATVAENVALPHRIAGETKPTDVETALQDVRLSGLEGRYPGGLSGGQKMRVSIARALASKPDIIFFDEPFAALDEILRFEMNDLLLKIRNERGIACIFVTHSLFEAAYLADRILVMHQGRIEAEIIPALDRKMSAAEQRASKAFLDTIEQITKTMEQLS